MNEDSIKEIKVQHIENYKTSLLDVIQNNTNILIDEDIMSLFKKPPLDSMDRIKNKILEIAKRNELLVHIDNLEKYLNKYRNSILKCFQEMKKIRLNTLKSIVNDSDEEIVKINKKNFLFIDKEIKNILKNEIQYSFDNCIIQNTNKLFKKEINEELEKIIMNELNIYLKNYIKQLLKRVDNQLMIKDSILINACKEHSERYLFTLNNSRLLNGFDKKN